MPQAVHCYCYAAWFTCCYMGLHYLRLRYIVVFHNRKDHYSFLSRQDGVGGGDTKGLLKLLCSIHLSKAWCRYRLASNGLITPPWGVPISLPSILPSSCSIPAFNHLSTYSNIHFSAVCWFNNTISFSWLILSKNPLISTSNTHAYYRQFVWHWANASCALLPDL